MAERYRYIGRESEEDLTFTFYRDGSVKIIDNCLERSVTPKELQGQSYEYYVGKRIQFIRTMLTGRNSSSEGKIVS
ncbi:hypothetical protein [Paenibacillus turpanensis]|uniref:hypothetical protein n=1 Tax=Paenibacillus turpanensis TaxID=2689078 RepID=UPI00140ACDB9|nr:hypothetical protein [Paenibacillus turpanensis]